MIYRKKCSVLRCLQRQKPVRLMCVMSITFLLWWIPQETKNIDASTANFLFFLCFFSAISRPTLAWSATRVKDISKWSLKKETEIKSPPEITARRVGSRTRVKQSILDSLNKSKVVMCLFSKCLRLLSRWLLKRSENKRKPLELRWYSITPMKSGHYGWEFDTGPRD